MPDRLSDQSRVATAGVLLPTPFGLALAEASAEGLTRLCLGAPPAGFPAPPQPGSAQEKVLAATTVQLEEYFSRRRQEFDLPLAAPGTEFQRRVWQELLRIPYGQTISYAELAKRLGDPKCIRAAGRANGSNPVWIIIPCHRVIGADGGMTGYGGGIAVKRALLELEGALLPL